jgi:hypothetical protein
MPNWRGVKRRGATATVVRAHASATACAQTRRTHAATRRHVTCRVRRSWRHSVRHGRRFRAEVAAIISASARAGHNIHAQAQRQAGDDLGGRNNRAAQAAGALVGGVSACRWHSFGVCVRACNAACARAPVLRVEGLLPQPLAGAAQQQRVRHGAPSRGARRVDGVCAQRSADGVARLRARSRTPRARSGMHGRVTRLASWCSTIRARKAVRAPG